MALNVNAEGSPMFRLSTLNMKLKIDLKQLNLSRYSNISTRVREAKEELEATQLLRLCNPIVLSCVVVALTNRNLIFKKKKGQELVCKFLDLSSAKEDFSGHRSRIKWLAPGDHSTRLLHWKLYAHRGSNIILSLQDCDGNLLRILRL